MQRVRVFVRSVARRLGVQWLMDASGGWLSIGVGAAAALLLAERLLSLGANAGLLVAAPVLAAGLASVAAGLTRWPTPHAAALCADSLLKLDERLSSSLVAGEGPMADMLRADAERRVAALEPHRQFPIRVPERFRWLALCLVGLLITALMPTLDVFGWGAARTARRAELAAVRQGARAAGVGLGNLAAAGRQQGIERTPRTLDQMGNQLERLATSDPTAEEARQAARGMLKDVENARAANAAQRAAEPKDRTKAEAERDLLLSAQRLLEGWQRDLVGESSGGTLPPAGKATDDGKGKEAERPHAADFVRGQETPPVPRETVKVESRLLATRPAAEAATRRDDVPWQYRAVVRRYFSTGGAE